jgi:hypothetical protein
METPFFSEYVELPRTSAEYPVFLYVQYSFIENEGSVRREIEKVIKTERGHEPIHIIEDTILRLSEIPPYVRSKLTCFLH